MNIVFACGADLGYAWNGASFDDGIGGSEGCLIRLAEALARRGHNVWVFNDCRDKNGLCNGVTYVQITHYHTWITNPPVQVDLAVSWRDWNLLIPAKASGAKACFHSTHDIPVGCHHPCSDEMYRADNSALDVIDRIVYLNPHHRRRSPWWPDAKSTIILIGIEKADLSGVVRDPARVITCYHPNRGLHELRAMWPVIKAAVPEATLTSYWWEGEHALPGNEALGIAPMRRLSQKELLVECAKSGVFAYPSTFEPEISPASCILAQAGGAYPVVIPMGGMQDVVQWGTWVDERHNFADTLIYALRESIAGHYDISDAADGTYRECMMDWATQIYDWDRAAEQWEKEAVLTLP